MKGKVKKNKFRIDRIQNRNTKFTSYIYNRYFRTDLSALADDEHTTISHGRRFASYQNDFGSASEPSFCSLLHELHLFRQDSHESPSFG